MIEIWSCHSLSCSIDVRLCDICARPFFATTRTTTKRIVVNARSVSRNIVLQYLENELSLKKFPRFWDIFEHSRFGTTLFEKLLIFSWGKILSKKAWKSNRNQLSIFWKLDYFLQCTLGGMGQKSSDFSNFMFWLENFIWPIGHSVEPWTFGQRLMRINPRFFSLWAFL